MEASSRRSSLHGAITGSRSAAAAGKGATFLTRVGHTSATFRNHGPAILPHAMKRLAALLLLAAACRQEQKPAVDRAAFDREINQYRTKRVAGLTRPEGW